MEKDMRKFFRKMFDSYFENVGRHTHPMFWMI